MADIIFIAIMIIFIIVDILQIKNRNKHMKMLKEDIEVTKGCSAKLDELMAKFKQL